ncbi:MAG: hypothetical protein RMY29_003785 [Nostoc sp. CreGUA01]|nr:hypothetical protein [Nostoc sp. CreGUA01]
MTIDPSKPRQMILLFIITFNLISTWLHYTDNALFLSQYPGPEWFTSAGVISVVIVMTPVGLLGYWFYTKSMFWLAYLLLALYSITSISSPGHYLFPMVTPMSGKMHSLICLDGVMGLLLIGFLLWSSLVLKEWHSTSVTN